MSGPSKSDLMMHEGRECPSLLRIPQEDCVRLVTASAKSLEL